jgi:hypothetical protein
MMNEVGGVAEGDGVCEGRRKGRRRKTTGQKGARECLQARWYGIVRLVKAASRQSAVLFAFKFVQASKAKQVA